MSIDVIIEGIGVWAPALPGWQASQDVLSGKAEPQAAVSARPAATLLAPAERRRAPDSVLFALEVAQQAAQMAARDGSTLRGVFASDHGDLAINDYLCATLTQAPEQLSPTRFHNSVHNAPAGYWAIATGCMASTTALSAGDHTFAAGLLEAALLARSEDAPVLFVACDLPACGPLADVVSCRTPFAVALVLSPRRDRSGAALRLAVQPQSVVLAPEPALLHAVHGDNPVARSLPLLVALARGEGQTFTLQAGPRLYLELEISPWLN